MRASDDDRYDVHDNYFTCMWDILEETGFNISLLLIIIIRWVNFNRNKNIDYLSAAKVLDFIRILLLNAQNFVPDR